MTTIETVTQAPSAEHFGYTMDTMTPPRCIWRHVQHWKDCRVKMIFFLLILFVWSCPTSFAQENVNHNPTVNVRLSVLLFPTTPLLTLEMRTLGNFTLQLETNFIHTHGINFKYFLPQRMGGSYVFAGMALVENKLLREDEKITFLPYLGYGNAYRFGGNKPWTFDNRIGLGATTNADANGIYPIIKTGIGRIF
ncbi:MAG: hypothetical protein ACFB10_03330 [Salibacteraceae bacterium]